MLAKHLEPFKAKAEARYDKGDYWWELRACDYYDEFEKEKIMYQTFQVKPVFAWDSIGSLCNNAVWMTPDGDKVLLSILNSKVGWLLISTYCTQIQNGYQLIWDYLQKIPIPPTDNQEVTSLIEAKVDKLLLLTSENTAADTSALEQKIDRLVYELYGLSEEEVKVVEGRNSG